MSVTASQPSTAQPDYKDPSHYESVARSVTPEGRVRVIVKKTRPRTYLARVQQPVIRLSAGDDDTDYYNETPEFQVGYRRPELVDQTAQVPDDLSDEIKIRLLLARKRALRAHALKWG
jgi:hypothetical protein